MASASSSFVYRETASLYGAGPYYRHSGQFAPVGLLVGTLGGIIAGSLLSVIYAYAVVYIPFIKLDFILCGLFGLSLGVISATVLMWAKVRNVLVATGAAFVVTLVAFYVCWSFWIFAVFQRYVDDAPPLSAILFRPDHVWSAVRAINDSGTWRLSDADANNLRGIPLTIIWVIEALLIFGMGVLIASNKVWTTPFCEKCQKWVRKSKVIRITSPVVAADLKQRIESRDFGSLNNLGGPTNGGFTSFEHLSCVSCAELQTLTVKSVSLRKNRKGRVVKKSKTLMQKFMLRPGESEQIARPKQPPPLAAAAKQAAPANVAATPPTAPAFRAPTPAELAEPEIVLESETPELFDAPGDEPGSKIGL